MERKACDVCGSSDFYENIGLAFCLGCNSQLSQFARVETEVAKLQVNYAVNKPTTSRKKQKSVLQDQINAHSRWTTNEAFNIILKKLVDILVQLGANRGFEKAVFQLWVSFLRKTEFAFCKPIYQTKQWIPKVPVKPRERDKQVILENSDVIEARKFRQNLLLTRKLKAKLGITRKKNITNKKPKNKKSRKKSKGKKSKNKKTLDELQDPKKSKSRKRKRSKSKIDDSEVEPEESAQTEIEPKIADQTKQRKITPEQSEQMQVEQDDIEENMTESGNLQQMNGKLLIDEKLLENDEQMNPKRKRLYCRARNMVSIKKVGVIARMTMERLLEILYLGLLLVHKRVLLCDLLGWIEGSELPFRECAHLLPEDMKFQTLDNATFKMNTMPTHANIRKNTAKLAKFLEIENFPNKNIIEIVERFVLALNLPDEVNQMVANLIALDPPQMPWENSQTKKVYPIPNYEGRALGFIIVVLKLIFGLDGKTEIKQSEFTRKLAAAVPGRKFFIWEDWINATDKTSELIRRKNIFENLDCLESYTDLDEVVKYYLNTAKLQKGRLTEMRKFYRLYWDDDIRNAVRDSILNLISETEASNEPEKLETTFTSAFLDWHSLSKSIMMSSSEESNKFHNATLKHLIDPDWAADLLKPKNINLDVRNTTAWTKCRAKTKTAEKPLVVYQPFYEYSFCHYWKNKRGIFNFFALNKLSPSLVWLIDLCANCGRLPSESLYNEVILIERILMRTTSKSGSVQRPGVATMFNYNKSRNW